jgi:hypothetical protein
MVRVVMLSVDLLIIVLHLRSVFCLCGKRRCTKSCGATQSANRHPHPAATGWFSIFGQKEVFYNESKRKENCSNLLKNEIEINFVEKMQLIAKIGYLKQLAVVKCFMTVGQRV